MLSARMHDDTHMQRSSIQACNHGQARANSLPGFFFPPCRSALVKLCFPPDDRVSVPPSDRVVSRMGRPRPQGWVAKERKGADLGFCLVFTPSYSSSPRLLEPPPVLPSTAVIPHSTSPLFSISFF